MIKSNYSKIACFIVFLLLFSFGAWGAQKNGSAAGGGKKAKAKSAGKKKVTDELLGIVPADSLFCLRVSNFNYTLSRMDRFLAGVSTMPVGLLMQARMHLASLLGDPALNNINTNADFAVFGTVIPGRIDVNAPGKNIMVAGLLPVRDYEKFIAGNNNCSQPDDKGVCKITVTDKPVLIAKKIGSYVLISTEDKYDRVIEVAKYASPAGNSGLISALDATEAAQAVSRAIWAYADFQKAPEAFEPMFSAVQQRKQMAMSKGMPAAGTESMAQDPNFEKFKNDIDYVTIGINIEGGTLSVRNTVSAVAGTQTADMFQKNSEKINELAQKFNAQKPEQMAIENDTIFAFLPKANQADFVGKYNLINLFNPSSPLGPVPAVDLPAGSGLAFAANAAAGRLTVNVALPREHLIDVFSAMQQKSGGGSFAGGGTAEPEIRGVPDYSTPISVQLREGFKNQREDNLDEALRIYLGIVANTKVEEKHLARAYCRLGDCYLQKGEEDKAVRQFKYVISNFPDQRRSVLKAKTQLKKVNKSD
ncbi:MAG: tetratricopeptide repeat protein [Planctomycetota bacterium]|jgi:tetratricopeptide (TPR) repeat protein